MRAYGGVPVEDREGVGGGVEAEGVQGGRVEGADEEVHVVRRMRGWWREVKSDIMRCVGGLRSNCTKLSALEAGN